MDALTLPHCAHGTAVCTVAKLNVREKPSGTILGQLAQNQRVTVWASDQGWMIVQSEDGLTGWAAEQYLKVTGDLVP